MTLCLRNEASTFLSTFNCLQPELETMASQKTMSSLIGDFTKLSFGWSRWPVTFDRIEMNWSFHAVVCNHYVFRCIAELWFEKDFEVVVGILRSRTERLWYLWNNPIFLHWCEHAQCSTEGLKRTRSLGLRSGRDANCVQGLQTGVHPFSTFTLSLRKKTWLFCKRLVQTLLVLPIPVPLAYENSFDL